MRSIQKVALKQERRASSSFTFMPTLDQPGCRGEPSSVTFQISSYIIVLFVLLRYPADMTGNLTSTVTNMTVQAGRYVSEGWKDAVRDKCFSVSNFEESY